MELYRAKQSLAIECHTIQLPQFRDCMTYSARPDPTRSDPRTESAHVEIERTSLRPDKVRGCVRRPKRSWVWSGLVGSVVEYRNDTTRPDQRQSVVGPV